MFCSFQDKDPEHILLDVDLNFSWFFLGGRVCAIVNGMLLKFWLSVSCSLLVYRN